MKKADFKRFKEHHDPDKLEVFLGHMNRIRFRGNMSNSVRQELASPLSSSVTTVDFEAWWKTLSQAAKKEVWGVKNYNSIIWWGIESTEDSQYLDKVEKDNTIEGCDHSCGTEDQGAPPPPFVEVFGPGEDIAPQTFTTEALRKVHDELDGVNGDIERQISVNDIKSNLTAEQIKMTPQEAKLIREELEEIKSSSVLKFLLAIVLVLSMTLWLVNKFWDVLWFSQQ